MDVTVQTFLWAAVACAILTPIVSRLTTIGLDACSNVPVRVGSLMCTPLAMAASGPPDGSSPRSLNGLAVT